MRPRLSVVVPAHDEEQVVGRCLVSALSGLAPDQVEVVVVCNGCSDRTAERAREALTSLGYLGRQSGNATVVELARPGKIGALNAGDAAVSAYPRVYLDADIELQPGTLQQLLGVPADGGWVGSPPPRFVLDGRPWSVRAFYRVWRRLPYLQQALVGNGIYVLSQEGRQRFGHFPEVVADDLFVQRLFVADETLRLPGGYRVRAPRTLRDLVKVRTRVHVGNGQLRAAGLAGQRATPTGRSALTGLARREPRLWPSIAVYAAVNAVAQARARHRLRRGAVDVWDRDDSSRREA